MNYTIYYKGATLPNGGNGIGLEVQPPLAETAENIAKILALKPEGYSTGTEYVAESAVVTRNDADGTAIVAAPNMYARTTPAGLAKRLSQLIDPCGRHEIDFVPPLSE